MTKKGNTLRETILYAFMASYKGNSKLARRFPSRGRICISLIVFLLLLSLDPSRDSARISLFVSSFFIFGILLFLFFFPMRSLKFTRTLPERCIQGQPFTYTLTLHNTSRLSCPPIEILDYGRMIYPDLKKWETGSGKFPFLDKLGPFDRWMGYPQWIWLMETSQEILTNDHFFPSCPARSKIETQINAISRVRGRRKLSAVSVGLPDPFQLFRRLHLYRCENEIICWPAPVRYASVSLKLEGGVSTELEGAPSFGTDDNGEIKGLRLWKHGDPVRNIDWKASARNGEILARERFPLMDPIVYLCILVSGDEDKDGPLASICHGLLLDADRLGIGGVCYHSGAVPLSNGLDQCLDLLALADTPAEGVDLAQSIVESLEKSMQPCRGLVIAHASCDETAISLRNDLLSLGYHSALLPVDIGKEH